MVIAAALPLVATVLPPLGTAVSTTALGGGLVGGLTQAVGPLLIGQSIQPRGGRAPGIKPGDLLRAALDIQALSERGLVPRVSTDPFTGDVVVSTADQTPILNELLADRTIRELLAPTESELSDVRAVRTNVLSLVPGQGSATARQIAPGRVSRGTSITSSVSAVTRKLSGPCAGASSGFQRIRCNVGGFA